MRAFRRFYLGLILALAYTVLLSATAHAGKAPYKPCLSRLTQQLKLAGLPETGRKTAIAPRTAEQPSVQAALILLGFPGFGLRNVTEVPSASSASETQPLELTPQGDPFALRV